MTLLMVSTGELAVELMDETEAVVEADEERLRKWVRSELGFSLAVMVWKREDCIVAVEEEEEMMVMMRRRG